MPIGTSAAEKSCKESDEEESSTVPSTANDAAALHSVHCTRNSRLVGYRKGLRRR